MVARWRCPRLGRCHVDLGKVVGLCNVCARRRRDNAEEVRLLIMRRSNRGVVDVALSVLISASSGK
eukprot:6208414-Pleurochrysis_carterae.AAC.4